LPPPNAGVGAPQRSRFSAALSINLKTPNRSVTVFPLSVRSWRRRIDLSLEQGRGPEDHNTAGTDGPGLSTPRIAAEALSLLSNGERTERTQLHHLAALQSGNDFFKDLVDKRFAFLRRQTNRALHSVANGFARDLFPSVGAPSHGA
jgi:hypothetical protein